jgi:SAM-dependent methyltransferase
LNADTYAVEALVEASHWWFVGRRRLFAAEINRAAVPRDARILDLGTSTGTNLRMLRDLGYHHAMGLDLSQEAIRFCESKGLGPVHQGDVCAIPFAGSSFDCLLATDILEHVDDDEAALAEIARVLAPGGHVLITVPTFPVLWGLQDEVASHRRRYRLSHVLRKVCAAGLEPRRAYYFNYLLFAPIWLARRLLRASGTPLKSENQINTPLLNRVLSSLFTLDVSTAPRIRPPFGVSALVMARRPEVVARVGDDGAATSDRAAGPRRTAAPRAR